MSPLFQAAPSYRQTLNFNQQISSIMKRFLALYHTPVDAMQQMANASEADKAAAMQRWQDWRTAHEENVVDFGAPTMSAGSSSNPTSSTTVGGYSVLQAESLNALKEACKDHPHNGWHPEASIEFLECMAM